MSVATAIRERDASQLPGKRDEDWRWTDLRGLIRQIPDASPLATSPTPDGPFCGPAEETWTVTNGHLGGYQPPASLSGVFALRLLAQTADTSHTGEFAFTVQAGESAVLLESYEAGASGYLRSVDLQIVVEAGGSLERVILAADDAEGVTVSTAGVRLEPSASFSQTILTSGARRQRIETRVVHPGGGASVRLDGAYILSGKRHADLTTEVRHQGRDGTTDQLTQGVVTDQARGVFQGRIVVEEGADGTDARMGHHALILSDRAEVDAKPELEIYADDVSCAHGNTVGAIDDDALFYARQRGIPEADARAMLTEAFVGEVVDRIQHEAAREVARAWVADQLRGA